MGLIFPLLVFHDDTIYALSTAPGKAAIAVIRISGPGCLEVYKGLCPSSASLKPRHASVRRLVHPSSEAGTNVLDSHAVVLYFPGPRTVTGEDVLELHIHGGSATVKAVLAAIPQCCSAQAIRYAEAGEFTKRSFANGRLDLAQVESLSDTLAAETEQQRRAAVRGNSGALGRTYEKWRDLLLHARGEIEALIDFSEDQHFDESPTQLLANVTRQVCEILESIDLHDTASQRSELLRNGIRIALLGPPNAGKSSLMNLIVGREASIVSGEAGTTRDIIEASLDIKGYLCTFADTAGFRSRATAGALGHGSVGPRLGAVEEEGIRRAKQKALDSDLIVVLTSIEPADAACKSYQIYYDEDTLQLAAGAPACLVVVNKSDAVQGDELEALKSSFQTSVLDRTPGLANVVPLSISCKEAEILGSGHKDPGRIHGLVQQMVSHFERMTLLPADQQDLLGVTERQRQLLLLCRQHLEGFMAVAESPHDGSEPDIVMAAEYLRYAGDTLARITGRVDGGDVEEILGVIFERFCVGK
ncbi:uncharacterized protein E0L32_001871 [Thyridium curvatum]|uniref:tRNA modification GTPase n=1 Tax=Thyridium curvatum TaxID=1093900 RepID=A0A507AL34_9PEZI|nr:uncharacterized protein E0L32_001808 [Thyridium curvatum]XP_030990007.1 uncharacterized protein E0L32_001871 [Thyridium curvatum]TPX08233.1 hypothetical protein E0L32_001808 [Thyridium curvatum]TPX08296.1 hypothetical protein E0L32_001871 [Thyridium curvatum]